MHVISRRNAHDMLPEVLYQLDRVGVPQDTRNGPALVFPGPVCLEYWNPQERVLFWDKRDANPFFHFFEALWMLGGKNDVAFVEQFSSNIANYSDDGVTFHGAYGYRWRRWFGYDQVDMIIKLLKENPEDRRVVLQMWDANTDLGATGKDFPCNLMITFPFCPATKRLDMVVYNRSNDIVWGAVGANVVHMSMLHEYICSCVGLPIGRYSQISSNMHGYVKTITPVRELAEFASDPMTGSIQSPYQVGMVQPFPMFDEGKTKDMWDQDLEIFLQKGPIIGFRHKFFRRVVTPLWYAYSAYKNGDGELALESLEQCVATDWTKACKEWILRRAANARRKRAQDDGVTYE